MRRCNGFAGMTNYYYSPVTRTSSSKKVTLLYMLYLGNHEREYSARRRLIFN